ncbi:hypothetical protein [Thalassotalea fusca]
MFRNVVLLSLCSLTFIGCVNVKSIQNVSVNDAKGSQPINAMSLSCSDLDLTRDCDNYAGANKEITLYGHKMRVAGNDSGTTILAMYAKDECGLGEALCQTIASNRNYEIIKKVFTDNNTQVVDVKPLAVNDFIVGYAITTNKEGYSLLSY